MTSPYNVPLIIRGRVIEGDDKIFGGRRGGVSFTSPDVGNYIGELRLTTASRLADLYTLSFDDIIDYLVRVGKALEFERNPYLQEAFELSCQTSGLTESILRRTYSIMHRRFDAAEIRNMAERSCGIDYLEGWVDQVGGSVPGLRARVRAFGARCIHIIAGNTPNVAAVTMIRNAMTRSDAIIKTPSNDPLTQVAIARTMIDMEPDHPLTKHISVAYWKGGDERIERELYDPRAVEKIVAWGGLASVQHISKYLQPGIDLITLDPKLSSTIVGEQAFHDEATTRSVARRLALDMGAGNQEGCVSARVIYVQSGTDEAGIAKLEDLGKLTFEALQALPGDISTPHKAFDAELKEEIDAARLLDEDYTVYGGRANEGAVVISRDGVPVDFSRILACRVSNFVPVDDLDVAIGSVNAYTQTIGIYPESLKEKIRDRLSFHGAQRLVSLGGAATMQHSMERQDGIEPVRRMCKWVVEEICDGEQLEALAG